MVFVLDGTNKSLKFTITAGAGADVHFTSHWADATTSGLTEGQTQGTSNGSTAVDAVASPAASTRRVVKLITFHNTNTTLSRTVTLVNDVGGTSRTIAVFTLAPLATWYSDTAATTAIADGDKGDITVSGSGATWTIDNNAITTAKILDANVTLAKIANMTAGRVIGRTGTTGAPQELTLTQTLDLDGSAAQGDIFYRGASTWDRLSAGTKGRILRSLGVSANPAWAFVTPFKNVLINGDMQVSQRGTSFTSTYSRNNNKSYTLDRWYIQSQGTTDTSYANDVINVNQSTTDVPSHVSGLYESRINSMELDPTSGVTTRKFGIAQIVERRNCRHLRGSIASLSFKAKLNASSGISDVRAVVLSFAGTADAPPRDLINTTTGGWQAADANPTWATVYTACNTPANLNLTTSWATYQIENISIPSDMNNLVVFIWNNDKSYNATDLIYITDVQLEPGPVCTEFEVLPIEVISQRCYRYFYATRFGGRYGSQGAGNALGGDLCGIIIRNPGEFRVTPAQSLGGFTGGGHNFTGWQLTDYVSATAITTFNNSVDASTPLAPNCTVNTAPGTLTAFRWYVLEQANSTTPVHAVWCDAEMGT